MDVCDDAQELIEKELEFARRQVSSAQPLPAVGHCHFCEHEFEEGSTLRFCDKDCLDDYEKQKRMKAISGK